MSRKYKIVVGVVLGIILLFGGYKILQSVMDNITKDEITKRVEAEMELKQLKKEYAVRDIEIDSLKTGLVKLNAVIEYQKKYPQIIVKKYEIKSDSIAKLPPSEQYKLFSSNINNYLANRNRYSLQRFK